MKLFSKRGSDFVPGSLVGILLASVFLIFFVGLTNAGIDLVRSKEGSYVKDNLESLNVEIQGTLRSCQESACNGYTSAKDIPFSIEEQFAVVGFDRGNEGTKYSQKNILINKPLAVDGCSEDFSCICIYKIKKFRNYNVDLEDSPFDDFCRGYDVDTIRWMRSPPGLKSDASFYPYLYIGAGEISNDVQLPSFAKGAYWNKAHAFSDYALQKLVLLGKIDGSKIYDAFDTQLLFIHYFSSENEKHLIFRLSDPDSKQHDTVLTTASSRMEWSYYESTFHTRNGLELLNIFENVADEYSYDEFIPLFKNYIHSSYENALKLYEKLIILDDNLIHAKITFSLGGTVESSLKDMRELLFTHIIKENKIPDNQKEQFMKRHAKVNHISISEPLVLYADTYNECNLECSFDLSLGNFDVHRYILDYGSRSYCYSYIKNTMDTGCIGGCFSCLVIGERVDPFVDYRSWEVYDKDAVDITLKIQVLIEEIRKYAAEHNLELVDTVDKNTGLFYATPYFKDETQLVKP